MPPLKNFAGTAYTSQSDIAAGEVCINFIPEAIETDGGKARAALYPTPGVVDKAALMDAPGRGVLGDRDRCHTVFGETVYEVDSDGTPHERGKVSSDENPAQLITNGDGGEETLIISGRNGYILDLLTNALTLEVSDVTMGDEMDGFFLALDAETSTFKISEEFDGKTWDPLQLIQRSDASDRWLALIVASKNIFLLGEKTCSVYYNAGGSQFPFRSRNILFEPGILAPWSLAAFGDSFAYLGRSKKGAGAVYWMNGYSPNRISNHAVEWAISQYKKNGGVEDAIGWSYELEGHSYYVLEFPTQGKTWVYDPDAGGWHQRGFHHAEINQYEAWRPRFFAEVFGQDLVCDGASSHLYRLDSEVYTDVEGKPIRRVRRPPRISSENKIITLHSVELEAERGVGLAEGQQGDDPQIGLRVSVDGGKTFSDEITQSLGKRGAYDERIRWERLGAGPDIVLEFVVSDPVPVRLFDCYVEAEVGRH